METMLKPNYQVELVVKGRSHFYRVTKDGKELDLLPGVTGYLGVINKPALVPWAKRVALESVRAELLAVGPAPLLLEPDVVDGIIARAKARPDEVKDAAADYGTRLHAYADYVIKGLPIGVVDEDLKPSVDAFTDWYTGSGLEFVMGDTAVASLDLGYGGKFDAVARNKAGELGVIDFKTSNAIYDETAFQVAAYCEAASDTYGVPFTWAAVVRFGKTKPDFEVKYVKDIGVSLLGFIAAKNLKDYLKSDLFLG